MPRLSQILSIAALALAVLLAPSKLCAQLAEVTSSLTAAQVDASVPRTERLWVRNIGVTRASFDLELRCEGAISKCDADRWLIADVAPGDSVAVNVSFVTAPWGRSGQITVRARPKDGKTLLDARVLTFQSRTSP